MATLGRHSESESGALLTWIPRIIFSYVALVMIAGGLTLAWIKCPGRPLLQTQTARLTPVELRTGAGGHKAAR